MTTTDYHPSPASLFISHARETGIVIWHYCEVCQRTVQYQFVRDDGKYEVYRCPDCGIQKGWAVR